MFGEMVSGLMEKVMSEEVSHWEDCVLTMQQETHQLDKLLLVEKMFNDIRSTTYR